MVESNVIHVCRHANDPSRYITGHIEIEHTGYTCFFCSYDGLLHAFTTMMAGNTKESLKMDHGYQ